MERKYKSEKQLREKAEEKVRILRRKNRMKEDGTDPDAASLGTNTTGGRLSRGNSFDDANDVVAAANQSFTTIVDAADASASPLGATSSEETVVPSKPASTENISPIRGQMSNQYQPKPHGTPTPQRGNGAKETSSQGTRPIPMREQTGSEPGATRAESTGRVPQQMQHASDLYGEMHLRDAAKQPHLMIGRQPGLKKRSESAGSAGGRGSVPVTNFDPLRPNYDNMSECASTIASEPDRSIHVLSTAPVYMMDAQQTVAVPVTGTISQGVDGTDLMTFQAPVVQTDCSNMAIQNHQMHMDHHKATGDPVSGMLFVPPQMTFQPMNISPPSETIFQQRFGTTGFEFSLGSNHMMHPGQTSANSVSQDPASTAADPFDELVQKRSTKPQGSQ